MKKVEIIFGTMMNSSVVYDAMMEAFKAGYKKFDFAERYQNQQEIGRAIKDWFENNPDEIREEYFFQSKIWTEDIDVLKTKRAFMKILTDLNLDYIDSILIHRPSINLDNSLVCWEELIEHKKLGLVKYIGVSNFEKEQILYLWDKTNIKPQINQIEFSLVNQRWDRVSFCIKNEIQVQSYGCFNGVDNNFINKLSSEKNIPVRELLASWILSSGISPIIKSVSKDRIVRNLTIKPLDFSKEEKLKFFAQNSFDNKYTETFYNVVLKK